MTLKLQLQSMSIGSVCVLCMLSVIQSNNLNHYTAGVV